jgi:hypothetical protein
MKCGLAPPAADAGAVDRLRRDRDAGRALIRTLARLAGPAAEAELTAEESALLRSIVPRLEAVA